MASLGNDLATKRKELDLSIEDVHNSTKIPIAILESIEDDSIFTTLNENKTYIRSYIRSYARALKIDDNQIIRALDQTEKGNYSGFPKQLPKDDPTSGAGADNDSPAREEPPEQDSKKDRGRNQVPDTDSKDEEVQQYQDQVISSPPTVNSIDWADMGRRFTPLQTKPRMWAGLILLILAIAATAFFIIYQNYYLSNGTGPESTQNASTTGVDTPNADSLQLNFVAPPEDSVNQTGASVTALEAFPDTLTLVVYAAYGILEPVRIFTDVMDSLNPYWIEEGDAYQFDFVNTIRIRGQYSRMVLLFNGHIIQNFRQQFYNPETGMLEISRSFFLNDSTWLQPPPDSLDIDAPPPTIIKERPTFN